jgi:hypothetical protein
MDATMKTPKEIVRRPEVAKNGKKPSPTKEREVLIDGLNHDLAGEYQARS